jgi:membrane protein DedA with SNARE-associated domain
MIHFMHAFGAWLVAVLITLECSGIPVPGETTLVAWALYAGTSHTIKMWTFITAAIVGAIAGNFVGYAIGRWAGYRLFVRHGARIGLSEGRLKIGQYLFHHYGTAAIVIGRFLPLFRSALPILAGANRMPFWPFAFATLVGAVAWIGCVGLAAFYFGATVIQLSTSAIVLAIVAGIILVLGAALFLRQHEAELLIKAEQEIPGPLPLRPMGLMASHF